MTDERVMRRLRAANPAPLPHHEADGLFERLVAQPGDARLTSSPRPHTSWRRRGPGRHTAVRRAVVASAATAMAAVAVVVATHAGSSITPSNLESGYAAIDPRAASVLARLAADAAKVAPSSGRYLILPEADTYSNLPGQTERLTSVDDTKTGANLAYSSDLDLRGGTPAMRHAWHRELGIVGIDALIDPVAFLYPEAWYAALPTDPNELRSKLVPLGMFLVSTELGTRISNRAAFAALDHGSLPASMTPRSASVRGDDVYEAASDLLRSPLVSSALRSALYKVLATTGGVSVDAHTTDPAGRPAISMSRSYGQDGARLQSITWENPATGAVLAQRATVHGAHAPATGTSTAVYQPVRSANAIPANPYGH